MFHPSPRKFISLVGLVVLGVVINLASPLSKLNAANSDPPRIHGVASVLFNGNLYVTGYVSDDSNVAGYIVTFSGDVVGTTIVQDDGRFWFTAPFEYPYGSAVVRTVDRDRKKSDPVSFEFHE